VGERLEHAWTLSVREPTAVLEAKTDCGCSLASLRRSGDRPYEWGTPLEPGEELAVVLRYDTRGRRGAAERRVTLRLEDRAPVVLTLDADVRPWLLAEPDEFPLLRVLQGEEAECSFAVRAASGEAFALTATGVALPPWVRLELVPDGATAEGRARRWQVRARLSGEAPRGTYSYPLEVQSDVTIPGSGDDVEARRFTTAPSWNLQVLGPVALSSPTMDFGVVPADAVVARSVRLESFEPGFVPSASKAKLLPVRPGEPFPLERTARIRRHEAAGAVDFELTLDGLAPEVSGSFLGKLVIETGHPELPLLEALVRGVRAPEGRP
jgi:hypothetical protein